MPPKYKPSKKREQREHSSSTDSYGSIDLPVKPMSQLPYENACHAAVTGMLHNYFASAPTRFSYPKKKVGSVEDVKSKLYGTKKGTLTLDKVANIEKALRAVGMSSEGLGAVSGKTYRRPPLNGRESILEKLHDGTPLPICLTRNKANIGRSAPIEGGHYVLGVGASKSKEELRCIDPSQRKPRVRTVRYSPDGEGKLNIGRDPYYMGAFNVAYPSEDWSPPASTSIRKRVMAPQPAVAAPSLPSSRGRSSTRSAPTTRLSAASLVGITRGGSRNAAPQPPSSFKTGGATSALSNPLKKMPPRMQRRRSS